ncbi:MAG TPA: hypothetical protein VHH73_17515, partial [Verrucomicrobiae bacterium]|nr:hypothetical protein [Verrucomicrobiae bacterium]
MVRVAAVDAPGSEPPLPVAESPAPSVFDSLRAQEGNSPVTVNVAETVVAPKPGGDEGRAEADSRQIPARMLNEF